MSFELKILLVAIGGLFGSAIALMHPVGPALILVLSSPFDPLMTNLFGNAGNYVTVVPILLLLAKVSPATWPRAFLGTRVQRALLFFLLAVSISYLIGYMRLGPGVFLAYLQRITGFALVAVFASGFRNERYVDLCVKALAVSTMLFALLSMLEFYLGLQVIPTQSEFGSFGLIGAERTENVHEARLRGAGNSVSINAFALGMLVPIGLSMGWLTKKRPRRIVLPSICLVILLTGLFGTISRSGLLGLAAGAAVVAISAYRLNPTAILSTLILAGVLASGASQVLTYLDLGDEFESRLTSKDLDYSSNVRQSAWVHGFKLFADSPIWGVGYGVIQTENVRRTATSRDPHNHYIRILSFYGVLGGSFFAYLLWAIFRTLSKSRQRAAEALEYWRPYFLAGFVSLLVVNFFNSYFFDRFMFVIMGFAAALEFSRQDRAAQEQAPSSEGSLETSVLQDWSQQHQDPTQYI